MSARSLLADRGLVVDKERIVVRLDGAEMRSRDAVTRPAVDAADKAALHALGRPRGRGPGRDLQPPIQSGSS